LGDPEQPRPASDALFGMSHFANSFRMIAVDLQAIQESRIAKTFHTENRSSAIRQLGGG
jgi:hypothetical protein